MMHLLTFVFMVCGGVCGGVVLARRAEVRSIAESLLESQQESGGGLSPPTDSVPSVSDLPRPNVVPVVGGAVLFAALRVLVCGFSLSAFVITALLGGIAGRLYISRSREQGEQRELRSMEFYLPAVMERIVMSVGSGLDIVPALQEACRGGKDPVSAVLREVVTLSESGAPVDAAFESVASSIKSVPVRHALTHLALAYRQGGEIVRPLKELSDATQVAYQEAVEEKIARLPVQAVLPLLVTFTGLIICFLTVPLMQVGAIASKVAHVAR